MYRHAFKTQLLRRFEAGVADDDHTLVVDDDGLAEAELFQARRHRFHRVIVLPWVAGVGLDLVQGAKLNLHGLHMTSPCFFHKTNSV